MERRLTELWYGRRGARAPWLLQPFAYAYGAVVGARHRAYERGWLRSHAIGRPVIVVGNLTVGGTGKTPLVVWLAERLEARGLVVGVVSRGYGRSSAGQRRVDAGSRWQDVGDEPLLIHRRTGCATIVAEDRVAGARRLAAEGADVILCDDGLQHLRLARDCEIVVIDGARGFGNGRLLPAGPLREPVARLRDADGLVVNGSLGEGIEIGADAPQAIATMRLVMGEARHVDGREAPRPLASFMGSTVHAVAGIGHPARFFRDLAAHGLRVIEHAYPDHHPFAPGELDFADDLPVLMTEKDAARCGPSASPRLWYVPVEAQLDEAGAAALLDRVSARIDASRARLAARRARTR